MTVVYRSKSSATSSTTNSTTATVKDEPDHSRDDHGYPHNAAPHSADTSHSAHSSSSRSSCTPLSTAHIFKLSYALALAGRFSLELGRFLQEVHDSGSTEPTDACSSDAGLAYFEACLLAQGFYQVTTPGTALAHRVDRIWLAARTFYFRGMITMVDGNGKPISAREQQLEQEQAQYEPQGRRFEPADIPPLLPERCRIAVPAVQEEAGSYSEPFLWASAGCVLGKHCVNTAEWPVERMALRDVAAAVAALEARLRAQEEALVRSSSIRNNHDAAAAARRSKRVWCPVAPGGPPDKVIVDLCRRLEAKDQQYRSLLAKFRQLDEEERLAADTAQL